ncbi:MAG: hypothetical protein JSW47_10330 [Phycisphaerales bacterium]|nr:MAG: hypothetical protein JSW47_10330 [Phycisphaerales bacterium]
MTGNRYRILTVILAMCVLAALGVDCSGGLNGRQKSLAGVKLITVHVNCSKLAKDVGLDQEEIRKSMTAQLEDAGIKVVRPEIWSTLPERCRLRASIQVYKPPHLDVLIYNLKVEFVQAVTLARMPETEIDATTWDRTWFAHGSEKRLAEYVPHNLKVMTAMFIRDHRQANSADGENAKLDSNEVGKNRRASAALAAGFIASKTSGVFHKSDCRWAQKISADNLVNYENKNEAIKAGKRPCRLCNP